MRTVKLSGGRALTSADLNRSGALPRDVMASAEAIVDDVVTSAATVEELAGVLRRAGAERIEVWTLTRTYPPSER